MLKSKDLTIRSNVSLGATQNCPFNSSLEVEWTISRLAEGSNHFGSRKIITTDVTDNSLLIKRRTLEYGLYYLEQRVGSPKTRLFNYNFGFLKVKKTPLHASVSGPAIVARGYNDFLVVDAQRSFDPDLEQRSIKGMTFQWYCKRNDERIHGLDDRINRSRIPLVYFPSLNEKLVGSGCFGTGKGRINETGPILRLPVSKMKAGLKYQIILIATKDSRDKMAKHTVKVDQVATMSVKIS
jgi:hypothetical protein